MKTHILIVDDDRAIGKMVGFFLDASGYQTTVLDDPRTVSTFLKGQHSDLVLLDVMLPYIDGFTLCETFRDKDPDIPVIFLTARNRIKDKLEGFRRGADDYITKPFEPSELLMRIEAVLRRYRRSERDTPSTVINVGGTTLDLGRLQFSTPSCQPVLLTPTEIKILECLMRNANIAISREKLINWTNSNACENGSNRIDVYIRRLRKKIEVNPDDPDYVQTVRGFGYVFREESNRPGESAAG